MHDFLVVISLATANQQASSCIALEVMSLLHHYKWSMHNDQTNAGLTYIARLNSYTQRCVCVIVCWRLAPRHDMPVFVLENFLMKYVQRMF